MPRKNPKSAALPRPWWRRLLRRVLQLTLLAIGLSVLLVVVLRFVPPPTTAFMLERRASALLHGERGFSIDYRWQPWSRVSDQLPISLVAAEDQKFPHHRGFDFESMRRAWDANQDGRQIRGGSTISQQVAKNLFLWSGRSLLRKAVEAWFTVLIETLWPKQRILEVYMNVAEFGDGIYGAEAAARHHFSKSALALTAHEAAVLASVLPNPKKLHADKPSPYVLREAHWVEQQVRQLGGPAYLDPQ